MEWQAARLFKELNTLSVNGYFNDFLTFLKEGYSAVNNEMAFDEHLNVKFGFGEIDEMFSHIPVAEALREFSPSEYEEQLDLFLKDSDNIVRVNSYSVNPVCYWINDVEDAMEIFKQDPNFKLKRIQKLITTFTSFRPDMASNTEIQEIINILNT